MSASGVTQNFQLPIYNPDDITSWLTDFNGAMQLIDAALNAIKTTADTAEVDLTSLEAQVNQLKTSVQTIGPDVEKAKQDITAINAQLLTVAGQIAALSSAVELGVGETKTGVIGVGETTLTLQFTKEFTDESRVSWWFSQFGLVATNVVGNPANKTVTVTVPERSSVVKVAVTVY